MRRKILILGLILQVSIWIGGCHAKNAVKRFKAEGSVKVYPVNDDQAWEIAKKVFWWEGADSIEEHRNEGYMLTSSGIKFTWYNVLPWIGNYGAVMGAWIEPVNKDSTKVTVVSKRRLAITITTAMTEKTFHKRFAQAVDIIKSGKPLPLVPPKLRDNT